MNKVIILVVTRYLSIPPFIAIPVLAIHWSKKLWSYDELWLRAAIPDLVTNWEVKRTFDEYG